MRTNGISDWSTEKLVNGSHGSNGVHNEGLRILIVGAGIGGLTAAIALRKQGHKVSVIAVLNRQKTSTDHLP